MRTLIVAVLGMTAAVSARAAIPGQDPDWPCQQRMVPRVSAGTYWNGALPAGDWHADRRVAALVDAIGSRDVPVDEAQAKIAAFAKPLKPADRAALLPLAFEGVVETANTQRMDIIDRIKDLTRRQRDVADLVHKADDDINAIPETATGDDAQKRQEAIQRKGFLARTFEQTQQTMRYACDVPAQLDSRLGAIAKAMQSRL